MPDAQLRQVATLKFVDGEAGDEGVAIVRAGQGVVGLALSLKTDGDIEVFLTRSAAEELRTALERALAIARDQ